MSGAWWLCLGPSWALMLAAAVRPLTVSQRTLRHGDGGGKPVREATVDGRQSDFDGAPAWTSLVLVPSGVRLPFDDLAVQEARRVVLRRCFPAAVSTLLRDDSHFEGAITVAHSPDAGAWLREDPFARIFPLQADPRCRPESSALPPLRPDRPSSATGVAIPGLGTGSADAHTTRIV